MGFRKQAAVARQVGMVHGEDDVHMGDCPADTARRFKRAAARLEKPCGDTRPALK